MTSLFARGRRGRTARPRPPQLEPLEDRTLLTAPSTRLSAPAAWSPLTWAAAGGG
jgi:hypothetical protein